MSNPYYSNWNYGYTLGPSTEKSRGAYSTEQSRGSYSTEQSQVAGSSAKSWDDYSTEQSRSAWNAQQSSYSQGVANSGSRWSAPTPSSQYGSVVRGWADLKKEVPPPPPIKGQVFVTACTTPTHNTAPVIGPKQPVVGTSKPVGDQAVVALAKLHELAVANRLVERYEKVEEKPVAGGTNIQFKVNLFLGDETYQGVGATIKQAKQVAAVTALKSTKYQTSTEKKFSMAVTGRRIGVTATSELHELATKKGVTVDFKFLEPFNFEFKHSMRMWSKKEMLGNYRVQLNVAGYEFYGQAELPQQAKHNAATQAMVIVRNLPDPAGTAKVVTAPPLPGTAAGKIKEESKSNSDSAASSTTPMTDKNINMALNEIAMVNDCVPEWTLISESGPPHQKQFTWQLSMGQFTTTGTGPNKKVSRNSAAEQMMATLPEEWKVGRRKNKRKAVPGGGRKGFGPPPPKKKAADENGKVVITADNPISCLFEYSKKVKIPDPDFQCVAENLLETWQKANQTFKKVEYTMQLQIDGKTYLASSNTKKAAKQACAAEAWNAIRASLL